MKHPLLLLIALLVLVGCGGDEPRNLQPLAVGEGVTAVQVVVAANDFEVGEPRIPVIFYDGATQVANLQAVEMTAYDTSQDPPTAVWRGPATTYPDYTVPYWVFYPPLGRTGVWGFEAAVTLANGETATVRFSILLPEETHAPLVGQPALPSRNRTQADVDDLSQLSSGQNPNPALYQMTVAEALASGRPTVVSFTTPAFCQTAVCAPVLQSVETVYGQYRGRANFIHLEIYKEFNPLVTADEVLEWELPSEPWTFVIDDTGIIRARLGGPVSPQELAQALETILNR